MWHKDMVMSRVNQNIQEELAQFEGEAITPNLIEVIKCKVENLLHDICMEGGDDVGRYVIEFSQSEAKTYPVPAQINKNAKWDIGRL